MVVHPVRSRLQCVSSSAASFASGGGGVGGIGGGGSGGGGGDGALEEKASSVVDVFESSSDVIILDVGVSPFYMYMYQVLCLFWFIFSFL